MLMVLHGCIAGSFGKNKGARLQFYRYTGGHIAELELKP